MNASRLRTAVIGCGGISRVHIDALLSLKDTAEIRTVCDIRPERALAASERTGAKAETDWRSAAADPEIDVVHLCLPHYLHAPVAIEALRAGKHVLTEKPMAATLPDARRMIEASERPGAGQLGVIFQNRYNAAVRIARETMADGRLGRFLGARAQVAWKREAPYYTESGWRGRIETEGAGCLINQAIHTLDLLSYVGGPIARVKGRVFTAQLEDVIDVENNACAVCEYAAGQTAVLHVTTSYACDASVLLEFAFENGLLTLLGEKLYETQNGQTCLVEQGADPALSQKAYWGSGHLAQIADFYAAIREGRHFWLDGRAGYPALNLVLAIVESSRSGGWVALSDPCQNA